MSQLALVYDAATVGAADWDAELGWFRRAVDVVGHKEVAYRLNVKPSNLTDALAERERKNIKGRWISIVRHMVPESLLIDDLQIIASAHGYEVKRKKPKNPEQVNREREQWLKEHAPAVLELMSRDLG